VVPMAGWKRLKKNLLAFCNGVSLVVGDSK